jgi:PTH2 family peptidyl-tRNA hydrolase
MAIKAGIQAHKQIDAGKTEFNGVPTLTCIAIGPEYEDIINPITGQLELY